MLQGWHRRALRLLAGLATCGLCVAAPDSPSPRAILAALDKESLWDAFLLFEKGATIEIPVEGSRIIYMGIELGRGSPAMGGRSEARLGHFQRNKGRYFGGITLAGLAGTGLAVAGNNGWLGNDPHYGRGTAAQQEAQRSGTATTGDTSVSVNQSGEGEKRSEVNIYIGNWIEAGGEAGKI
jgi:hypothetical protein